MHFAWETKVDVRYAGEDRGNCFWQNKLSYNANEYKTYLLGLVFINIYQIRICQRHMI